MKSKLSSEKKDTEEKRFETKFFNYLKENTNLSAGSINEYVKILNRFVLFYGVKNVCATQEINKFIIALQEKRIYTAKYAFRHFFDMIGRPELYQKLKKGIKIKPRKKLGIYLGKDDMKNIIKNIPDTKYKLFAEIQYETGLRFRDLSSLMAENIITDKDGSVKIYVVTKGEKEKITYLTNTQKKLKMFAKGKKGLIFYDNTVGYSANYMRYYRNLVYAAELVGHPAFRSHDFRRNLAEDLIRIGKDMRDVKNVLGHKHISTTERYFKYSPIQVKDVLKEVRT